MKHSTTNKIEHTIAIDGYQLDAHFDHDTENWSPITAQDHLGNMLTFTSDEALQFAEALMAIVEFTRSKGPVAV